MTGFPTKTAKSRLASLEKEKISYMIFDPSDNYAIIDEYTAKESRYDEVAKRANIKRPREERINKIAKRLNEKILSKETLTVIQMIEDILESMYGKE